MNDWEKGKKWSDQFLPEIKSILGVCLISEPPVEEDQKHNTDLIVLKLEAIRVACRIRRYEYLENYGDEFTIRSELPSGGKTELTKIIKGWGSYLFYGFADENEKTLARWALLDLNIFRIIFMRSLAKCKGRLPGTIKKNSDGSSLFRAFKLSDFPDEFIFKASPQRINYDLP